MRTCRPASSRCSALALAQIQRFDDGSPDVSQPRPPRTSRRSGAEESHSEGSSTSCARSRERRSPRSCASSSAAGARASESSLRATDDDVDVSVIARAQGGGGHRRAAGFSTTLELDELISFLREAIAEQLDGAPAPSARRRPQRSPELRAAAPRPRPMTA